MSSVDSFDVISHKDFDIKNLSNSKLITEDKDGNPLVQNRFYLNYNEKPFKICTPNIKIEYGGIPSADLQYVNSDDDRKVLTLPLTPNTDIEVTRETKEENDKRVKDANTLKSVLTNIDEYFQNEEVIKTLFNTKNPSKFLYAYPLVKDIGDRGEGFRMKFKWQMPHIEVKKEDGTIEEIPEEDLQNIDTISSYLKFLSTGKYTFKLQGWAQKNPVGKKPLEFGISLTLLYAQVNENKNKVVNNNVQRFVDSDEEDNNNNESAEQEENDENDDSEDSDNQDTNGKEDDTNTDEDNGTNDTEEALEEIKPKRRIRKKKD